MFHRFNTTFNILGDLHKKPQNQNEEKEEALKCESESKLKVYGHVHL